MQKSLAIFLAEFLIARMVKLKKVKGIIIPAHPTGRVNGTAYDINIKTFPLSQDGRKGPFKNPPVVPPLPSNPPAGTQQDFDDLVAFFVDHVGSKLERLNGLQFILDRPPGPGPSVERRMSDELGDLASALHMDRAGTASNPPDLTWPLLGGYKITWTLADAAAIGCGSLVLNLYFEIEPDYRMVVNCSVELTATMTGIGNPVSSSSSYIATSSSG